MSKLFKVSKRLREFGLNAHADTIDKVASKAGEKAGKNINWNVAEKQLLDESQGSEEISRERVIKRMGDSPLLSDNDLAKIREIEIDEHFARRLNKRERVFLELGSFLVDDIDLGLIADYLLYGEEHKISKPGDLSRHFQLNLSDVNDIKEHISSLNQLQQIWHEQSRDDDSLSNQYMTHDVVHDFGDGWVVVYVPAVGEGPAYKGNSSKSNDRTVEGNICGLCLGETMGLYQTNGSGKIYSVRDPSNNPKVTIRILGNQLAEAKGKNNLPPSVEGASKAKAFFEKLRAETGLSFEYNQDYRKFPPLTLEAAEEAFREQLAATAYASEYGEAQNRSNMAFYTKGWVVPWYRSGSSIIDSDIQKAVDKKDIMVLKSGLPKKYKELCEPTARHWAKEYVVYEPNHHLSSLFSGRQESDFEHETWKVYRKSRWMQLAVETLFKLDWHRGVGLGLHMVPEFKEYGRDKTKRLISDGYFSAHDGIDKFYKGMLNEAYPDLEKPLIDSVLNDMPKLYFGSRLYNEAPEYRSIASNKLVSRDIADFKDKPASRMVPESVFEMAMKDQRQPWDSPSSDLMMAELVDSGQMTEVEKFKESIYRSTINRVRYENAFSQGTSNSSYSYRNHGVRGLIMGLFPSLSYMQYLQDDDLLSIANLLKKNHLDALLFFSIDPSWHAHMPDPPVAKSSNLSLAEKFPEIISADVASRLASESPEIFLGVKDFFLDSAREEYSDISRGSLSDALISAAKEVLNSSPVRYFESGLYMEYYEYLEPEAIVKYIESGFGTNSQRRPINPDLAYPYLSDHSNAIFKAAYKVASPTVYERDSTLPSEYNSEDYDLTSDEKVESEEFQIFSKIINMVDDSEMSDAFSSHPILYKLAKEWARYLPEAYLSTSILPPFAKMFPDLKTEAIQNVVLIDSAKPFSIQNVNIKASPLLAAEGLSTLAPEEQAQFKHYVHVVAEEFPDSFLHEEHYQFNAPMAEIFPDLKHLAVRSLAEQMPNEYYHRNYHLEYPEYDGVASLALARRGEEGGVVPSELPYRSPIEYREDLQGADVDQIPEDDLFEPVEWEREINEDGEYTGEVVPIMWERKLASLRKWLLKNNYKYEAESEIFK